MSAVRSPANGVAATVDVLVIGGGPAGSTCAALLAERGLEVMLCEREVFPRFHVGESLLPRGNAILERLNILDRCRAQGWTTKPGASFLFEDAVAAMTASGRQPEQLIVQDSPAQTAFCSIKFQDALCSPEPDALQVPRAQFDALLLERARELGVTVVEGCRVRDLKFSSDSATVAVIRDHEGGARAPETVVARFVVDASGQSGFLAKRLGLRQPDPELVNLASFAHYDNWIWPAAVPRGNIQVISRRDLGWLWIIPLSEDRVSVGLVQPKERAAQGIERERRLEEALETSTLLQPQALESRRVSEVFGLADFGYGASQYISERWALVGDAGSFVDPVFSTGVYLALSSGAELSDAVWALLSGEGRSASVKRHYESTQRRRYKFFRRFVLQFYKPGMRDLLCQRRETLNVPDALSTVLAGEWNPPWRVRWRLEAFYLLAALQRRVPLVERLHPSTD